MAAEPLPAPATPNGGFRFRPPRTARGWLALAVVLVSVGTGLAFSSWLIRRALAIRRMTQGVGDTVFYAADGRAWFRLDERRRDVPLQEVCPHLRQAVVAVEDHRFYRHGGIDPVGVSRAAVRNVKGGRVREGGSTITQQLARTLFLSNRRTFGRKSKEAVLALLLEVLLSKEQILELYLNRVYLSGGVYGVEAMSESLYGKRAQDLTLAEAALLAGLIQAPSALSPWTHFDKALERSHVVLERMREEGFITPAEEERARRSIPRITKRPRQADARSGYAKEYLRQLFHEAVGQDDPPDWQVETTFVPELQAAAERAVAAGLRRLGRKGLEAALVALDAESGDVLAMVGGADYSASAFNRASSARRQPGSAFKPFVYAVALENGFSPVSEIDVTDVAPAGEEEWQPEEAHEDEWETVTLRDALATSDNRAALALQARIGTRAVLDLAQRAGLSEQPAVPSLALGTGLVTPLDLAAAYTCFPGGGVASAPRALTRILDADGAVAFGGEVTHRRVVSPAAAFQAASMLRDVVERGTGAGARSLGFPVAGKTGTTDDFKDAWFVGFTSSTVVAVWVGRDQPETIMPEGYGARVALPIFTDFMRSAAKVRPPRWLRPPAGVHAVDLCRASFRRPGEECPSYVEYFKEGDEVPEERCSLHDGSLDRRMKRFFEGLFGHLRRVFDRD